MRLETRDYYSFSGMSAARAARFAASVFGLIVAAALLRQPAFVAAAAGTPTPEQFIGFRTGTDNKLARWDRIVDYMKQVAATSFDLATALEIATFRSEDHAEALAAMREKRPPNFKGV